MANQELINFIKNSKITGQTDEQIKSILRQSGWQDIDIDEGFKSLGTRDNPSRKMFAILILTALLLAGGVSAYYFRRDIPVIKNFVSERVPVVSETPTPILSESPESKSCDNYQCLISAASECQNISALVNYTNIPFALNPNILVSGRTQYEIKKSSVDSNCTLTFSSPATTFVMSEKGRQAALSQGMTDAQITAQLKAMNETVNSGIVTKTQSICTSDSNTIVSYVMDAKNGTTHVESNGQTVTYTTSSGRKLVCKTTAPTN